MNREALFAKIHYARVTGCLPEYSGSITIDSDLLDATGIRPNEKVLVADTVTLNRFETYVFLGRRGSKCIEVNGAAASLTSVGNPIIIMSFCHLDEEEFNTHCPKIVICDNQNVITKAFEYQSASEWEKVEN